MSQKMVDVDKWPKLLGTRSYSFTSVNSVHFKEEVLMYRLKVLGNQIIIVYDSDQRIFNVDDVHLLSVLIAKSIIRGDVTRITKEEVGRIKIEISFKLLHDGALRSFDAPPNVEANKYIYSTGFNINLYKALQYVLGVKEESDKGADVEQPVKDTPKKILTVDLLDHQIKAVLWMKKRENSTSIKGWNPTVHDWLFVNTTQQKFSLKNQTSDDVCKGGILAYEMGLGKTVIAIYRIVEDFIINPKNKTLIVLPPALLAQWKTELGTMIPKNINITHGEYLDENSDFNVTLTTYDNLKRQDGVGSLFTTAWYRIILDEAHKISSIGAQVTQSVLKLQSDRCWAMTGTPITNRLPGLYPLFKFVKFAPWNDQDHFKLLNAKMTQRTKQLFLSTINELKAVFQTDKVMLRETQENVFKTIDMKKLHRHVEYIDLSDKEKDFYCEMSKSCFNDLKSFTNGKGSTQNTLAWTIKLRMSVDHPSLAIQNQDDEEFIVGDDEDEYEDDDEYEDEAKPKRKTNKSIDTVVNEIYQRVFSEGPLILSSKEKFIVDKVKEEVKNDNTVKILIFSQFVGMLFRLKTIFDQAEVGNSLVYGEKKLNDRTREIAQFKEEDDNHVLLISLHTGSVGLNLQCASVVILVDPWWSPAIEYQAICRAYRINQKKEVHVFHLIARHTIDDHVLAIQKDKEKMIKDVFGNENLDEKTAKNRIDLTNFHYSFLTTPNQETDALFKFDNKSAVGEYIYKDDQEIFNSNTKWHTSRTLLLLLYYVSRHADNVYILSGGEIGDILKPSPPVVNRPRRGPQNDKYSYIISNACVLLGLVNISEMHWCILAFVRRSLDDKFTSMYIDSNGATSDPPIPVKDMVDRTKAYFREKYGIDVNFTKTKTTKVFDKKIQMDGYNCGIFCIRFAEVIIKTYINGIEAILAGLKNDNFNPDLKRAEFKQLFNGWLTDKKEVEDGNFFIKFK